MPFLNEVLVANGSTTLGRIVFAKALLDIITNDHVTALAVNAGGTGYVVGETFDVQGGTPIGAFNARGVVTAASGGVVSAVKIISCGAYSALPGVTGQTTTNASLSGNNDLTVDLTTLVAQWTLDRSTYVDPTTDFEWICTSVKASNPPTIGMTTVTGSGNDSSQLMVASAYNGLAAFTAQPDTSPVSQMFLNLPSQNPEIYVSTNARRVNVMARDGNSVQYGGLGLFIPLTNVDASYPFPALVHGQSTGIRAFTESYTQNGNGGNNAGLLNPGSYTTVFPACRYRDNLSTGWLTIANVATSVNVNAAMWPHAQAASAFSFTHAPQLAAQNTNPFTSTVQPKFGDESLGWFVQPTGSAQGVQGVSPLGTGLQMSLTVTAHIVKSQTGEVQVIGYVDGYENVHGVGLTAFEEIESYNSGSRYIVFPDTNGSDTGQWVAMEII